MITKTRERPIIFSGEMVRAILEGRKTQTRRVIKPQPEESWTDVYGPRDGELTIVPYQDGSPRSTWQTCWDDEGKCWMLWTDGSGRRMYVPHCPYGAPGERLWVRETWADHDKSEVETNATRYRADLLPGGKVDDRFKWRPSIHMPRLASRILLEITNVRVELVQAISHADALAEGMREDAEPNNYGAGGRARDAFAKLWDYLNAKRGFGWDSNSWVRVIEFKKSQRSEAR